MSEDSAIAIEDEGVERRRHRLRLLIHSRRSRTSRCLPVCRRSTSTQCSRSVASKGHITQAQLIEALHTVELTPEVLMVLIDRVTAEGVALVEDEEEDLPVEIAPA